MITSRAGLLTLVGLLVLPAGTLQPSPPARTEPRRPQLSKGQSLERPLRSGEEQSFRIFLSAGDLLAAEVDQRGIDAVVTLLDPAGEKVIRIDSPNGRRGKEPIRAVATVSGVHLLNVRGADSDWHGSFRVTIGDVRPATATDRASALALRAITEGDAVKYKQPAQAINRYRTAIRIGSEVKDVWSQMLAQERLGEIFEIEKRYRDAFQAFDSAQSLARSLGDRGAEARLTNRAGLLLWYMKDPLGAQARCKRALDLAAKVGDPLVQALAHNNLALISRFSGKFQQALASYEQAEKLLDGFGEPAVEALIHGNRGALLLAVAQPEGALDSLNKSLSLLNQEDRPDLRLLVLSNAGQAFHTLGDRRRAFLAYRGALQLAQGSRDRASTLGRVAMLLLEKGDRQWAFSVLQETLQLARLHGERRAEAIALADLAHFDDLRGREEEAIRGFEQALGILEEFQDQEAIASVLFGRAEAQRDLERWHEAITSIQGSIDKVESLRSDLLEPESRVKFFATRHGYYEWYIDLLLEIHQRDARKGRHVQAFEVGEHSRARSLLDDMAGRSMSKAMDLEEIQSEVIDADSLLLSYLLGEKRSVLWAITPTSISVFNLPPRRRIEDAVRQARDRLTKGDWAKEEIVTLSGILFPPDLGKLSQKRLLIVPDGALHLVPFAALCDPALPQGCLPQEPLVLDHELVHLPSASVLGWMRRKLADRRPAPRSIAALADPVFQRRDRRLLDTIGEPRPEEREPESGLGFERLPRLRRSATEVKEMLKLFSAEKSFSALGPAANRDFLLSPALARYRMVHIATHSLATDHPDLSGLVLSRFDERGRPVNGFVGASEIYKLELPVELAVLSACGTGLGREVRGEGVLGLTRAFLHAGAKRVVVSLWNVREGDTSELMPLFYARLKEGHSPAAALQSAQASMVREGRRPWSWAGFVLQGEPR